MRIVGWAFYFCVTEHSHDSCRVKEPVVPAHTSWYFCAKMGAVTQLYHRSWNYSFKGLVCYLLELTFIVSKSMYYQHWQVKRASRSLKSCCCDQLVRISQSSQWYFRQLRTRAVLLGHQYELTTPDTKTSSYANISIQEPSQTHSCQNCWGYQ